MVLHNSVTEQRRGGLTSLCARPSPWEKAHVPHVSKLLNYSIIFIKGGVHTFNPSARETEAGRSHSWKLDWSSEF